MRKNLFIVLAVLTGLVISMTACDRLGDVEELERKALKDNLGLTTVNIDAIQGVTVPATGGIPARNIVANDQYTGTVTWSPAPGNSGFTYGTRYTATITLKPKDGCTLQTVKTNFFTVTGATATNSANSGVIKAVFPPATISVINIAAIQGLTAPVTGGTPVTRITENAQYAGTVTWSPTVSGTFAAATQYTATVTLTPKTGYTLQGVAANFFKVAGATATNSVNSGVITVVFPTSVINIAAIQGVTAPVTGETPVTRITESAQYTGTVTWSPAVSGTFATATQYTATITLTPKTGYTLQGVAANFFTVVGATATNSVNSGVITVMFPIVVVNIATIQGVTTPVTGQTPITSITENAQYTGTVTWSPTVSGTFIFYTQYTATITLTIKTGYTLQGVAANFFTVPGADSVTSSANSGVITAVFPSTAKAVVNMAVIQGVTIPTESITPVTVIMENAQYTGTVSWSPAVSGTFVLNTRYTATITLTAKTGYTLQGVAANFFTVVGATATNSANSGVITAVFPAAGKKLVEMVQIPGGSFNMGSSDVLEERPVHTVTLSGFYMGKYEVTQEQWTVVMGNNPSSFTSSPASGEVQSRRPVENVSWYDTLIFCNKLSMREGLSPAYRISGSTDPADWGNVPTSSNSTWDAVEIVTGSSGYRLPTEAQWEYAARGGNGSPGGYKYSGSNTVGDVAWYYGNSSGTHEVGKKTPNGLGLYDMSGNVYEWCWDRYGNYSSGAQINPMGAASGAYRVLRGGGWHSSYDYFHSTWRGIKEPFFRYYIDYNGFSELGFRLARP